MCFPRADTMCISLTAHTITCINKPYSLRVLHRQGTQKKMSGKQSALPKQHTICSPNLVSSNNVANLRDLLQGWRWVFFERRTFPYYVHTALADIQWCKANMW